MEQPDTPSSERVASMCPGTFVVIAEPAGEPQVLLIVRSVARLGYVMLHLQKAQHVFLSA
jgi:hypothetical protein